MKQERDLRDRTSRARKNKLFIECDELNQVQQASDSLSFHVAMSRPSLYGS